MKVGSLFTGYGGLDMAVGGDLAWYAEIEPAACKVLAAHYPNVPNLGDIKAIDWTQVEPVDVLTGGYPCQPFSQAGLRKGTNDERHLWPYVRDAISALRPGLVVLENVRGHLSLGIDTVLGEMAGVGYDARWGVVRASDAGAPHQRARVFIAAHPHGQRPQGLNDERRGVARWEAGQAAGNDWFAQDASRGPWGARPGRHHSEPEGAAGPPTSAGQSVVADADGRGHGEQQDPSRVGGVEGRSEGEAPQREWARPEPDAGGTFSWGKYSAAVDRWQRMTRPAPAPTITDAKTGKQRLNPVFVEWMMGLPEGHVTGHGLTNAQCLKMLGNGVVPQQAALALRLLGVAA